jgi:predicted transcriptional regulator
MTDSTTMTVRISQDVKQSLERLSGHTKRSKSFLAGEAIASYVTRELSIMEAIERGRDDARAGRVMPHKEAISRLRATVERAKRRTS